MRLSRLAVYGAILLVGGYAVWRFTRPTEQVAAAPTPVPVGVAQAKTGDLPMYLLTIGTVRALNAVDIKPQVGGVLIDVPVKEGDRVTKDQVIAVIDPRPLKAALDRAQAQLQQDQAQLANAELDRQRYAALARNDFASRQQLDTQVATVGRLQGVVAADQASIDEAKINLGYSVLRSPFDGRVGIRRVDPGNLLQANSSQAIITLVQDKPTSVIFTLPETDLPIIQTAQAKSPLNTLADTADQALTLGRGKLATIDNAVDSSSGTIQLRAIFPNDDGALTAGQYVNVRLQIGTAKGIIVPHTAVQHAQEGLYVFTVGGDKTIKRQNVKLAYDDGQQSVLTDGVAEGTSVVVSGQTRIGPGTKVAFSDKPNGDAAQGQSQSQGQQSASE